MGPQLFRCGKRQIYDIMEGQESAFNGAATFSLRKAAWGRLYDPGVGLLQWGRNFFVAESSDTNMTAIHRLHLQWGRNFFVAERS